MMWVKNIFREIFGLFVDDLAFALAILIWIGMVHWAASHVNLSSATIAIALFTGLALILLESVTRYARLKWRVKK